MTRREALHRLVDDLPEQEIPTAARVLEALRVTADPVLRALLSAPADDEQDDDNFDGGLAEARREAEEGLEVSHEEKKPDDSSLLILRVLPRDKAY